jgi:diaminopimelate decarboxylase
VDALDRTIDLVKRLREIHINITHIDMGGGLGITYKDEAPPHPTELAAAVRPLLADSGCTIVFEPGRVIVGNAGALVTKVLYTKKNESKDFFIVDAAMNDLARPSLYGSYQGIAPLKESTLQRPKVSADVVGPICESGDFLAKDRVLPQLKQGDHIAVMSAGAYGFTMSSNYNTRRRVPEVLVHGDRFDVIRERETYEHLLAGESIPDYLAE